MRDHLPMYMLTATSTFALPFRVCHLHSQPWRPSLQELFEDYWVLMPEYQGLSGGLDQLQFERLLFGVFPTFRESPLQPGFDRWGSQWDVARAAANRLAAVHMYPDRLGLLMAWGLLPNLWFILCQLQTAFELFPSRLLCLTTSCYVCFFSTPPGCFK